MKETTDGTRIHSASEARSGRPTGTTSTRLPKTSPAEQWRTPLKTEAEDALSAVLPSVNAGTYKPDGKLDGRRSLEQWKAGKASRPCEPTLTMYGNVIDGWLVPNIGGLKVTQLLSKAAGELVAEAPLPRGSQARSWGALGPVRATGRPSSRPRRAGRGVGSHGQRRPGWLQAPEDRTERPRRLCVVGRGGWSFPVRRSPMNVCWPPGGFVDPGPSPGRGVRSPSNVDLERGALKIVETRVMAGNRVIASDPKTNAGRRSIPLDAALVAELTAHRRAQKAERLKAGEAWEDTGYVFTDELGAHLPPVPLSTLRDDRQEGRTASGPSPRWPALGADDAPRGWHSGAHRLQDGRRIPGRITLTSTPSAIDGGGDTAGSHLTACLASHARD